MNKIDLWLRNCKVQQANLLRLKIKDMELVKNDLYLLLIDEKAELKGTVCLCYNSIKNTWKEDIVLYQGTMPDYHYRGFQKIIAYFPLTKEAKELDLPLLPNPFENDIEIMWLDFNKSRNKNCPLGKEQFVRAINYKKSQSKQFSLDDMKKVIEFAYNAGRRVEMDAIPHGFKFETYREELIQSLSTQQLPKEFVPKYKVDCVKVQCNGECGKCNYMEKVLKTITNSEGKEEIQGRYVY